MHHSIEEKWDAQMKQLEGGAASRFLGSSHVHQTSAVSSTVTLATYDNNLLTIVAPFARTNQYPLKIRNIHPLKTLRIAMNLHVLSGFNAIARGRSGPSNHPAYRATTHHTPWPTPRMKDAKDSRSRTFFTSFSNRSRSVAEWGTIFGYVMRVYW